jgi:isoleucyl-tRNA synthetase
MPANMAVAVNPDLSYSVVQHEKTGKLLVATDLAESLAVRSYLVVYTCVGASLMHLAYHLLLIKQTGKV